MEMAPESKYRRIGRIFLFVVGGVLVAAAVAASQFHRVRQVNFMGDESGWIASAGYYTQLILDGDFSRERWAGEHLANWGSINPPLGKYLLGAGIRLHPSYEEADSEFRGVYRFSQSYEWNATNGNVPLEGTVIRSREVTAVFFTAALVLLYFAVSRHANVLSGLFSVSIVLTNGWVVNETTPVLTDPYYFCFNFALFAIAGSIVSTETLRSKLGVFVVAGLLTGGACLVKINGLPFGVVFVGLLLAYVWAARRRIAWRTEALALASFGFSALAVIYLLNPFFWPMSWEGVLEFPRLYARWPELFAVQREQTPWGEWGRTWDIFLVLFGEFTVSPLEFIPLVSGIAYGIYVLVRSIRDKRPDVRVVPLLFFVAHVGFAFALMPVNYRRYYVLAVISVKVMEAIGLAWPILVVANWTIRSGRGIAGRVSRNSREVGADRKLEGESPDG